MRHERTLPAWFAFFVLLVGMHLSATNLLYAQTVTFPGTSVNYGNVNVCAPGQLAPAPCTETMTLNFKVTAGGMLGAPRVLTMGAPNLDFTLAGSTCTESVATGSQCSVLATVFVHGGSTGGDCGTDPGCGA